jgi:hypothetical protein
VASRAGTTQRVRSFRGSPQDANLDHIFLVSKKR